MTQVDAAKAIKTALAEHFADIEDYTCTATLEVADDYRPVAGSPVLLVADDGGTAVIGGPWLVGHDMHRITVRLTAFARGRTEARTTLEAAIEHLLTAKPAGIARIENVPAVLDTKDRETGAYLASITMPVVVRPITATN